MLIIVRTTAFIWHGNDAGDDDCDKDDHGGDDELHDATITSSEDDEDEDESRDEIEDVGEIEEKEEVEQQDDEDSDNNDDYDEDNDDDDKEELSAHVFFYVAVFSSLMPYVYLHGAQY